MSRLRSSNDIQRLFRIGKRVRGNRMNLLFQFQNHQNPNAKECRWAIAVGRSFGGATRRNWAKRIIREEIRQNGGDFPLGVDCIIEVLAAASEMDRNEFRKNVSQLIGEGQKYLWKKANPPTKGI